MTEYDGVERSTATEVLRRLLDERGVEWWQKKRHTCWKVSKGQEVEMWRAWEAPDGSLTLKVDYIYGLTPEQAIAATLGPAARHPKPHEKWTTVLLPEIAWGWDDSWPDYLSVAHDTHGEWRTYVPEATLGAGTCHIDVLNTCDCAGYECSEYVMHCNGCGHKFGHMRYYENSDVWMSEPPNYCPNCGRKVVSNG